MRLSLPGARKTLELVRANLLAALARVHLLGFALAIAIREAHRVVAPDLALAIDFAHRGHLI